MSGKNILAFEADPIYASLLSDELGSRGYTVEIVTDGAEGLEKAMTVFPDLIYLCIELPRISGFSICNKLRKGAETKDVPLLITSAEATDDTFDKHKKLKVRADEYLHKPFDGNKIYEVVTAMIGSSELEIAEDDILLEEIDGDLGTYDLEEIEIDDEDVGEFIDDDLELDDALSLDDIEEIDDLEEISLDDGEVDDEIGAFADEAFAALELQNGEDTTKKHSMSESAAVIDQILDDAEDFPTTQTKTETETQTETETEIEPVVEEIAEFEEEDLDLVNLEPADQGGTPSRAPHGGDSGFEEEHDRLKAENFTLHNKIEKLERAVLDAKSKGGGGVSSREFLDLRELLNKKDRELLDLKDAVNDKDKQLLESKEQLTSLQRKRADLEDVNISFEKRAAELEDRKNELTTDKEMLNKKVEELEGSVNRLENRVLGLRSDLKQEKESRRLEAEQYEEEKGQILAQKEKELDEQKQQDGALRDALQSKLMGEKEKALEEQKEQLESEATTRRESDLAEQRQRYDNEIQELKENLLEEKQQAIDELTKRHQNTLADIEEANQQAVDSLSQQLTEEQKQNAAIFEEKAEALSALTDAREELKNAQQQLDEANAKIEQGNDELDRANKIIADTDRKLKETEKSLEESNETINAQKGRIAELDSDLSQRNSRVADLISEVEETSDVLARNDEIVDRARQALSIASKLLEEIHSGEPEESIEV